MEHAITLDMKLFKILVKGSYYPIVLAIIKAQDIDGAIKRFRAITGDRSLVEAVPVRQ